MRPLGFAIVLMVCGSPFLASSPTVTGGTGTIYVGSYAKRMVVIDEATERVTTEIPLATGIPWSARRSQDGTRLYIQNADQEHFEVVDIATRQSIDSFTLSDGNKKVRVLDYAVDPQHRVMTFVTRTTTKLIDRFEIGAPTFIQYDLKSHQMIRTLPWSSDPEPGYFSFMRYSPDGKLLYVFSETILVLDASNLQQLATWDLALPNEPSLGRFDLGSLDDTNDDPAWFSALFTMKDPVQNRPLLVVGRVNLDQRTIDFFPLGPATDQGALSFALSGDRKYAYALLQRIGHHELWTIDLANKRRLSRVEFSGRPRMAIRTSSNGKIIYLHQAGNTIALYEADGFKYLRTITLDGDMPYGTFHVVASRPTP
jgi:DNA-binding beta-propeller fold protein YncE